MPTHDMVALKWSDIKETDNGLMLYVASMQKTVRFYE